MSTRPLIISKITEYTSDGTKVRETKLGMMNKIWQHVSGILNVLIQKLTHHRNGYSPTESPCTIP